MAQKPQKSKKIGPQFVRRDLKLSPNHGWRTTPGYKLCVIARGEIRFEYPDSWVVVPTETSLKLHDKPYPDDSLVLEVSVLHTPPIDWKKIPSLDTFLIDGQRKLGRIVTPADVKKLDIPGLQLVWAEHEAPDTDSGRPVIWRQAHCTPGPHYYGPGLVGILTFGFWKDIYEQGDATWNHIASTIVMGEKIADPTLGPPRPN